MWRLWPLSELLRFWREKHQEFKVSLGYIGSSLGYTDSNRDESKVINKSSIPELSRLTMQPVTPAPGINASAFASHSHVYIK